MGAAAAAPTKQRVSLTEERLGMVLVMPAIILMMIVAVYPILSAFWLSLHQSNIKFPQDAHFVGFENYIRIFASPHVYRSMETVIMFTVISVSIEFCLGMMLALIMNKALGWLTGIVRVAILVPWCTITVVTALAWKWMFTPDLTFSFARGFYGLFAQDSCVLCGHFTSIMAMVFADVWKTAPFIALLLLAGLQSIDGEMYEAADVDGAQAWTKFIKITLPSLKPAILVALLFRTLDAFRMFDLVYVMTGGANGTETFTMLTYNRMIKSLDMGLGSAMGVLIFIMVLGIALTFVKVLGADLKNEDGH